MGKGQSGGRHPSRRPKKLNLKALGPSADLVERWHQLRAAYDVRFLENLAFLPVRDGKRMHPACHWVDEIHSALRSSRSLHPIDTSVDAGLRRGAVSRHSRNVEAIRSSKASLASPLAGDGSGCSSAWHENAKRSRQTVNFEG
jgi:hypothetical protein